jgi:[ribosomal protein S5]-alanine N-acetyltransferase
MASCLVAKLSVAHPAGVAMAKTLPVESPSTRILTRLGFTRAEEASDPEHGTVWVWERPTPTGLVA